MDGLNDYHRTERFKKTLANFHSYCHRQSQESPVLIDIRSQSNRDITNYKSIRQLRKLSDHKRQITPSPSKIKEPSQIIQQIMPIKNSDLIQIIKHKLKNGPNNSKGEENRRRTHKKNSFQMKHYGYYQICNRTSKFNNSIIKNKQKKVELVIQNSKIKFTQHQKSKKQMKHSQMIVTLHKRPQSALQIPHFSKDKESTALIKDKSSSREPISKQQARSAILYEQGNQKSRDLSGWDWPTSQFDILPIEEISKRQQNGRKRRSHLRYTTE